MQRIAIIGSAGAGKTTFARHLGQILGIEVIHLDQWFWGENWTATPRDEWIQIQRDLLNRERWVIDGHYGGTLDLRLQAADTVIFLDLPRVLCLWRVLKRQFHYRKQTRPDMGPNCIEKIDIPFLRWIWNFPSSKRPDILEKLAHIQANTDVIHLTSPSQVQEFLQQLRTNTTNRAVY